MRASDPGLGEAYDDLVSIGLLAISRDGDGKSTWTLTAAGMHVARLVTMSQGDALGVLDALLEARRRIRRASEVGSSGEAIA